MCIRDRSQEDEHDFILLGYLAFFDAPKESAAGAIRKLQKLHVEVRVLTGDHRDIAVSVCRRLGIDTAQALTGRELEQLSDDELPVKVERTTLFAELSPKQKVQVVQLLRANGHTVGFLGDGMNDLPAIVEADVGISVDTAAEAVKEEMCIRDRHNIQYRHDGGNRIEHECAPFTVHILPHHFAGRGEAHLEVPMHHKHQVHVGFLR